ncbi:MAG: DUF1893 domain-containing protein [Rikenellaceae bacterium]
MKGLVERLDREGCSCVVANGADVRNFCMRGIADLHRLLREEAEFLQGALVADKVVGKGAAALMVSGGVSRLYTHIISEGALQLFEQSAVDVEYGLRVPHIINRDKSGWCPVETLCRDVDGVAEILPILDRFIEEISRKNR